MAIVGVARAPSDLKPRGSVSVTPYAGAANGGVRITRRILMHTPTRGALFGLVGLLVGLTACAPDLRLADSSGSGGTSTGITGGTATGGSTGGVSTSTSGGAGTGGSDDERLPLWATSVSGSGDEILRAIARNVAGEILVAAEITGSLDVDNLASEGSTDVAMITFSATGQPLSAVRLGGLNPQTVSAMAVDAHGSHPPDGRLLWKHRLGGKTGQQRGWTRLLRGQAGQLRRCINRGIGGAGQEGCAGVTVDGQNNIVVAGTLHGQSRREPDERRGRGPLCPEAGAWREPPVDICHLGNAYAQRARGVAIGADNSVFVLAEFEGTLSVGASGIVSKGGRDILLLKLAKDSAVVRSQVIGTAGDDSASRLVVDPSSGRVLLSGSAASDVDLGGGALSGTAFLAAYDGDGKYLFGRGFESKDTVSLEDIAFTEDGGVLVVGTFDGVLSVGDKKLTSAGSWDMLAVKLGDGGGVLWARSFGGADANRAIRVGVSDSGAGFVAGTFAGSSHFGETTVGPSQGHDCFLVGLTP